MNRSIHRNVALVLLAASTSFASGNSSPSRPSLPAPSAETERHDEDHDRDQDEVRLHLSAAEAEARGVRVEEAKPQHLRLTKEVGGAVVAAPTPTIVFNVNRADLGDMRVGQAVEIMTLDGRSIGRSNIANIQPPFEEGSRATVMTVTLPASASTLPVGTPLKGAVMIGELHASLAVRTLALQHFHDSKVVLAQFGDTYEARVVEIGRQTPEWTEVKSGLPAGTLYVTENVFVLGARLDKSNHALGDEH